MAQAFNASFQQVQWIGLAYLLAITIMIVSVGTFSGQLRRRKREQTLNKMSSYTLQPVGFIRSILKRME